MKAKIYLLAIILIFISCKEKRPQGINTVSKQNTIVENIDSVVESVSNSKLPYYYKDTEVTEEDVNKAAAKIIKLVKNKDKKGISNIIDYPLEREYPIPPIKDKTEFIERFDEVFDSELINKIKNTSPESWQSFGWRGIHLTEKKDNYEHLFLHFEVDDKDNPCIYSIECSDTEAKKAEMLIELERKELHESLKSFLYPVILMETPTHLIRIDCIKYKEVVIENHTRQSGFRYASWKKGSSISDKPDLILTNGTQFVEGSMCNTYYDFKSGDYVYSCHVGKWGEPSYIGYFAVYKNVVAEYDGRFMGDVILSWGNDKSGIRDNNDEIKVVYWSERSKANTALNQNSVIENDSVYNDTITFENIIEE